MGLRHLSQRHRRGIVPRLPLRSARIGASKTPGRCLLPILRTAFTMTAGQRREQRRTHQGSQSRGVETQVTSDWVVQKSKADAASHAMRHSYLVQSRPFYAHMERYMVRAGTCGVPALKLRCARVSTGVSMRRCARAAFFFFLCFCGNTKNRGLEPRSHACLVARRRDLGRARRKICAYSNFPHRRHARRGRDFHDKNDLTTSIFNDVPPSPRNNTPTTLLAWPLAAFDSFLLFVLYV
jgi:hypothetical protein